MSKVSIVEKYTKPSNKILKILILGGGPIGLFIGYNLLKKGNQITIFEKRMKYTRHNILSLQETSKLDTLSLIPSEIMDELNNQSSFSQINSNIKTKNIIKEKPYLMASSQYYYIVLNELETAYEKYFKRYQGNLIRPSKQNSFTDIKMEDNCLWYSEENIKQFIDLSEYDIIFINDGANSYYRNIYFKNTSYTEKIEKNIIRYGLDEKRLITTAADAKPLAYGLILIHSIDDKPKFLEKFRTEEKLRKKNDINSFFELDNSGDEYINKLSVKEILMNHDQVGSRLLSQNLFRMFVSENYLYISIMVNPSDVGEYANRIPNSDIKFTELPLDIQIYIRFALYYYDLGELIDPLSTKNIFRMFPLMFTSVKQSCTFIKKTNTTSIRNSGTMPWIERYDSYFGGFNDRIQEQASSPQTKRNQKNYQFIALSGDAMTCGNFHAGIVLNRNLLAVSRVCQLIDSYIDSYPKDDQNNLSINFLRQLFFHGNLLNQKARNEITARSFEVLIKFESLDNDHSEFNLKQILSELNEMIYCKNDSDSNHEICKNSILLAQFVNEYATHPVLQKILKYLYAPDKYKYNKVLDHIHQINTPVCHFD